MLLNCGVGENSLRVPWTVRRSNQFILKEISPEMECLMLKLKLQYFGHQHLLFVNFLMIAIPTGIHIHFIFWDESMPSSYKSALVILGVNCL